MNDLKEIKQAVVTYGLHPAFVKEMIKSWVSSIKVPRNDFFQLVTAVLNDNV